MLAPYSGRELCIELFQGRAHGFTLVEMLVVLFLIASSAVAAHSWLMPGLQKSRLEGSATQFLAALNLARSESILRSLPVSLCPSRMHETGIPRCEGIYAGGWILFANVQRTSEFDAVSDEVIRIYPPLSSTVTVTNRSGQSNSRDTVHFLPSGAAHRNQTFMFCSTAVASYGDISIVMNVVGRPRMQRNWGQCPANHV